MARLTGSCRRRPPLQCHGDQGGSAKRRDDGEVDASMLRPIDQQQA